VNPKNYITTEGSVLNISMMNKVMYSLKQDPFNHPLWRPSKQNSTQSRAKKLEKFKARFFK
jgi:hypothetical protein